MIVGSYASNYYGRPRSTHDADLFLLWNPKDIDAFASKLGPDFYADALDMRQALEHERISNIIHLETGFKADLSPVGSSEYFQQAFSRRKETKLFGQKVYLASPEDVILTKLLWAKKSNSLRQVEDAKGVFQIQAEILDLNYLNSWASKLSIADFLKQIKT